MAWSAFETKTQLGSKMDALLLLLLLLLLSFFLSFGDGVGVGGGYSGVQPNSVHYSIDLAISCQSIEQLNRQLSHTKTMRNF